MSRRSEYFENAKKLTAAITEKNETPTLLLHACCAPCSSAVMEYLSEYFKLTVFYYNPNISEKAEYDKRAAELKRLIAEMSFKNEVKLITGEYAKQLYDDAVKGLEDEPEGGKRCSVCFELRLSEAARLAADGGYDYYTTTLSISPHKNAALLNEIGEEKAGEYHVKWFPSDFKKNGGFLRSTELSNVYGLYRQDYCGCEYSRAEAEKRRNRL